MELFEVPNLQEFIKNHPQIKAVLWDMDGTLLNSEHLHAVATKEILGPYLVNFTGDVHELEERCNGLSDAQLIELLSQFCQIDISLEEFVERKNRRFIDIASKYDFKRVLTEEVKSFLIGLHKSGLKLALVTSSEREIVEYLFEKLELNEYFNLILTRNETILTKPSPKPYEMAMERLFLNANECLIFEDSVVGLEAAKQSGCDFYQVKWFHELQGIV